MMRKPIVPWSAHLLLSFTLLILVSTAQSVDQASRKSCNDGPCLDCLKDRTENVQLIVKLSQYVDTYHDAIHVIRQGFDEYNSKLIGRDPGETSFTAIHECLEDQSQYQDGDCHWRSIPPKQFGLHDPKRIPTNHVVIGLRSARAREDAKRVSEFGTLASTLSQVLSQVLSQCSQVKAVYPDIMYGRDVHRSHFSDVDQLENADPIPALDTNESLSHKDLSMIKPKFGRRRSLLASKSRRRNDGDDDGENGSRNTPKSPRLPNNLLLFQAHRMWQAGFFGAGVKIAVFDTGIPAGFPHIRHVMEQTSWTADRKLEDDVGHGTFVAGMIAGTHPDCPGMAPESEIYTFRVFSGFHTSFTSWFLDAFNYALYLGIDVLNLSIGGPDYDDRPFVEKVLELSARGIIVVSAIGNDGPKWGTTNNPADLPSVIGVGGIETDGRIASFSSRGMTSHEVQLSGPFGYGRVKPDIVTYSRSLESPSHTKFSSCQILSGTSVASPVVAGAVALLLSSIPSWSRAKWTNPGTIKRALIQGAKPLRGSSMFEQGAGLLDVYASYLALNEIVRANVSRKSMDYQFLSLLPSSLDMTESPCQYMWPYCEQPLYHTSKTVTINITLFSSESAFNNISHIEWIPLGPFGDLLTVHASGTRTLWPWSGTLSVHLSSNKPWPEGLSSSSSVVISGVLRIGVRSEELQFASVEFPIQAKVVPTPARDRRILWDQFHNLKYPPGFVPVDSLVSNDRFSAETLDWLGDHPHTNFHELFRELRKAGYYLEVWNEPLSCISREIASLYGALMIVDPEDFITPDEVQAVENAVLAYGLNLVVLAEWFEPEIINDLKFKDENTRSYWLPISGGSNVPSLNALLSLFGFNLNTDMVISCIVRTDSFFFRINSGTFIDLIPANSEVLYGIECSEIKGGSGKSKSYFRSMKKHPIFSMARNVRGSDASVMVMSDTHCLDSGFPKTGSDQACFGFFIQAMNSLLRVNESDSIKVSNARSLIFSSSELVSEKLQLASNESLEASQVYGDKLYLLTRPHSKTVKHVGPSGYQDLMELCSDAWIRKNFIEPSEVRETEEESRLKAAARFKAVQYATTVGQSFQLPNPMIPSRRSSPFAEFVPNVINGIQIGFGLFLLLGPPVILLITAKTRAKWRVPFSKKPILPFRYGRSD